MGHFVVANKINFAVYHALSEPANGILVHLTTRRTRVDRSHHRVANTSLIHVTSGHTPFLT
jgi:hypothetical protein